MLKVFTASGKSNVAITEIVEKMYNTFEKENFGKIDIIEVKPNTDQCPTSDDKIWYTYTVTVLYNPIPIAENSDEPF